MSGFTLSQDQSAGEYAGKVFNYSVAATHATLLAPGDIVLITGDANAFGRPEVDAALATGLVTGIIAAVTPQYVGEQLSETGLPASTAGEVQVHNDPLLNFDVDVSNGTLLVANVGLNVDAAVDVATKLGGLTVSNMTIDAGTTGTTQGKQFRIVALLEDEDGVLGKRVQVRINAGTISDGTVGVL